MPDSQPRANGERVLADLNALRAIGAYKTGVHKPTFSEPHKQSLEWLAQKLPEAGLAATIDGIGNVLGKSAKPGPKLLAGSHLESQNYAGWLDGPLGVVYALEAARVLNIDPSVKGAVEVAAWCDEEGHFGSFLGSRSYVGQLTEVDIDAARDRTNGRSMRDALAEIGLAGRPRITVEPRRHVGYLEAHIEQGDTLESGKLAIGVVTSIVGIWQYRINFTGEQNHAGTTRMAIRKDAGVALVHLASAIYQRFPEVAGPRTVWTTGRITLDPGAPSIVPGRAEMLFQFRDTDPALLATLDRELETLVAQAARGPCTVTIAERGQSVPQAMDAGFQDALERAAERHAPGLHVRMPSGAGHDAQVLAERMKSAMLFVPSIGGISHHYAENTKDADIVLGCQVLADAAAEILAPSD